MRDEELAQILDGEPYNPHKDEWYETYSMLCGWCENQLKCQTVEGMIEFSNGNGSWPSGGWVWDAGGTVSCLSYEPKKKEPLPRSELKRLKRNSSTKMCGGCAAQKGSEASVARHTRKDFKHSVQTKCMFLCHETGGVCGGWLSALRSNK